MSCDIRPGQGMSQTCLPPAIETDRKGSYLFCSKVEPTRYQQEPVLINHHFAGRIFQRSFKIDSFSGGNGISRRFLPTHGSEFNKFLRSSFEAVDGLTGGWLLNLVSMHTEGFPALRRYYL